jgi:hypothetical protein
VFPDAHVADLGETQRMERVRYGLALGVEE